MNTFSHSLPVLLGECKARRSSGGKIPLLVGNLLLSGCSSLVSFTAILVLPRLSARRRVMLLGGGALAGVLNGVESVGVLFRIVSLGDWVDHELEMT